LGGGPTNWEMREKTKGSWFPEHKGGSPTSATEELDHPIEEKVATPATTTTTERW